MWSLGVGGAERAVFQLVRAQRSAGLDAALVLGAELGQYGDRLAAEGIPVSSLSMSRAWDIRGWRPARRGFADWDVIHFHVPEPSLMLAASRAGARLFYTHRAGAFRYPPARRMRYQAAGVFVRRFAGVAGNTAHAAAVVAQLMSISPDRVAVVYNGLEWELLRPDVDPEALRQELGLEGMPVVGTSGNLRDWKRVDLLLDAVARTPGVAALIVGDGPERRMLEAHARTLGIADRTRFVGKQSSVANYLAVCDVFSLPSGPEESFGNSAVEAMSLGIPTIVLADGGGLLEHVIHEETGIIATGAHDLAGWLAKLAADPTLRRELGARGQIAVREKYTIGRMVDGYAQLYSTAAS